MSIIFLHVSLVLLFIVMLSDLMYIMYKIIHSRKVVKKLIRTIKEQRSKIHKLESSNHEKKVMIELIGSEYELYHRLYSKAKEELEKYEPEQSRIKP